MVQNGFKISNKVKTFCGTVKFKYCKSVELKMAGGFSKLTLNLYFHSRFQNVNFGAFVLNDLGTNKESLKVKSLFRFFLVMI